MDRSRWLACAFIGCVALWAEGCSGRSAGQPAVNGGAKQVKIGYVLHGLNDFTQIIQQGAEDAAQKAGVRVDVTGPAGFVATDAIAMFEGMTQNRVDGLVVVPMPGEVWVTPIRQAHAAGIPVLTANVSSPDSAAAAWFGQDEFASGVLLASELRRGLAAAGKLEGKITVGICAPGVNVLDQRYAGFKQGMEGSEYVISAPFDVTTETTANYGAWENLAAANSELVAMVGLCSMDLPNLARLKERTKGEWLIGGYDLGRETLDAVRAGTIYVALGQHPYLQGYLPVAALAAHVRDGRPLPAGWIDTGAEVVTKETVDDIYERETDLATQRTWYEKHIAQNFADLNSLAKPLPKQVP